MFRKIVAGVVAALVVGSLWLAVSSPEEDSALFNCHLHGDNVCGTTPGPFGFSNL